MKSYTDIEQSKKLAEILPIDTTDMCYRIVAYNPNDTHVYQPYCFVSTLESDMPCWSLAALLSVLPRGVNISTPKPTNELGYCCWNQYDEIYASNPVDACYEMIIKLNEQKLL